jgi:hypothetical protein
VWFIKLLQFKPTLTDRYYCQISEKYTIWAQTFARNYVLSAHYIALISLHLADLTIADLIFLWSVRIPLKGARVI